jgi:hypothetical protein
LTKVRDAKPRVLAFCDATKDPKIADILENKLVLTSNDLSMLYGNGTGVVCLSLADPSAFPVAEVEGTWDGGTGRFGGVSGSWSLRFDVAEPVGVTTQFIAAAEVISGHLTRPRDDDETAHNERLGFGAVFLVRLMAVYGLLLIASKLL